MSEPNQIGRSIKEIVEVRSVEVVNEYLSLGWLVVAVQTVDFGEPGRVSNSVFYHLGYPGGPSSPPAPKPKSPGVSREPEEL